MVTTLIKTITLTYSIVNVGIVTTHTINVTQQRHCEEGNARRGNLILWAHTISVQCVRFPRHSVPRNDVQRVSVHSVLQARRFPRRYAPRNDVYRYLVSI